MGNDVAVRVNGGGEMCFCNSGKTLLLYTRKTVRRLSVINMARLSFKTITLLMNVAAGIFLASHAHAQLHATQKEDVGFTALQTQLGASMPTGAGISVSQVEAPDGSGNYRPSTATFSTKNFLFPSGGSTTASGHANTVGQYLYGSSSLSPDIGVSPNRVTSYEANSYLGAGFLNLSNTGALPSVESNDIQNHSWIANLNTEAQNVEAMRRIDYAIQRDDFVAVFGLNNGSGTSVPALMAGAYNGITVGLSNGNHSRGGISLDGGLRTRPDIVVPTTATSWATPTVGGAAALLLETARGTSGLGNADRSEVVKSLLFTGATRDESEFGGAWTNSPSQPLDAVFGAGELNVLHSHDILVAGEDNANAAATVASTGWDLGTSNSTDPQLYFFDLNTPGFTFEIAASLVWNRNIAAVDNQRGPGLDYAFTPSLANLNLRLFSASGFTLGTEIGASLSEVDNVELILADGLGPGRYAWQVTSDTSGLDYGFSWNVEGLTMVPEPSVCGLGLVSLMLLVRRRR
jgi:hypothetical protein